MNHKEVSPYSVNCLLSLLGALAHGLDELLHGAAGDERPYDPATLLQPHPDNLESLDKIERLTVSKRRD